jgi:hypothetical protein
MGGCGGKKKRQRDKAGKPPEFRRQDLRPVERRQDLTPRPDQIKPGGRENGTIERIEEKAGAISGARKP